MKTHSVYSVWFRSQSHKKKLLPKLPLWYYLVPVVVMGLLFSGIGTGFLSLCEEGIKRFREHRANVRLLQHNRALILEKSTTFRFSPFFVPVHIFRNGYLAGSGVLVEDVDTPPVILTVGHLFPEGIRPARYSYESLLDRHRASIQKVEQAFQVDYREDGGSILQHDLAYCVPGQAQKIEGFFRVLFDEPLAQEQLAYVRLQASLVLRSLVSGETVECRFVTPYRFFLLPIAVIGGESGSGWIDAEGILYLTEATYEVSDEKMRVQLGLPEGSRTITALMRVVRKKPKGSLTQDALSR